MWKNQKNKENKDKEKMLKELERLKTLKILPCPFCGNVPEVVLFQDTFNRFKFGIDCNHENCPIQPFTAYCMDGEEAINDWNTRVYPVGDTGGMVKVDVAGDWDDGNETDEEVNADVNETDVNEVDIVDGKIDGEVDDYVTVNDTPEVNNLKS